MDMLNTSTRVSQVRGMGNLVILASLLQRPRSHTLKRCRIRNGGYLQHPLRPSLSSSKYYQGLFEGRSWLPGAWRGDCLRDGSLGVTSHSRADAVVESHADVVILSNGPGEVATWVKPVVEALHRRFAGTQLCVRISVVLAPCPHASGEELELVKSFKQVNRCQGQEEFWNLLLFRTTKDDWDWHKTGVCIFLGGDQAFALFLGRRLNYKTIIYAEDSVHWPGLADMYMLRSEELMRFVPFWAHSSCRVVGDLFSDSVSSMEQVCEPIGMYPLLTPALKYSGAHVPTSTEAPIAVVGLLPGSKASKLVLGVPYFMSVAEHLHEQMKGRVRFLLPLAPTATLSMLAKYADPACNSFISQYQWASGSLVLDSNSAPDMDSQDKEILEGVHFPHQPVAHLVTNGQVDIEIWQQFPAYDIFKCCTLCLTTIGTNTAELGYLGVPMLVVLPTHALEVFKGATGGVLGLLANAPGCLGNAVATAINSALLKSSRYIAWPNRWAREEVVPELVGRIEPAEVAAIAAHYLKTERKLENMQQRLLTFRQLPGKLAGLGQVSPSPSGAAEAIAMEVGKLLLS